LRPSCAQVLRAEVFSEAGHDSLKLRVLIHSQWTRENIYGHLSSSQRGEDLALFIVDNSDEDWKVVRYLHDWCQLSQAVDIATGYFEIGSLLSLKDEWQKVDKIRVLMGDEVSLRTKNAFAQGLCQAASKQQNRKGWPPRSWKHSASTV
jgi:hypothetical protein